MTWKEFLQHNFDKILLIIVFHGILVLMISHVDNPTLMDWLKGEAGTALGALLMLITGRASKPDPAVSASTTTTTSVTAPAAPDATRGPSGLDRDS